VVLSKTSGLVTGLHAATITAFRRTYAPVATPIPLPESDTLTNVRKPHAFGVQDRLHVSTAVVSNWPLYPYPERQGAKTGQAGPGET